jgi:beta-N-acetylhexosaminidase
MRLMRRLLLTTFSAALVVTSLSVSLNLPVRAQTSDQRVEEILASMSLEDRVGQLFMVSFYGVGLTDTTRQFLRDMKPGGFALFATNGTTPRDVTFTVNAIQTVATENGTPLLMAIDHEGGTVTRVEDGFTKLPWGGAIGAMPNDDARRVGQIAAAELSAVGVNMNLAPVADLRSNPSQRFMEKRVFGFDAALVGQAVTAYVQGLQEGGVIATLKHFPGHGAAGDSHTFLPTVEYSVEDMMNTEIEPFRAAIVGGADVVMVGHLMVPSLDPSFPAPFSEKIIQGVLRDELGFEGVIMTDSMDMGAVVDNYTRPDAAVIAIKTGIDLIASGPYTPMGEALAMKAEILSAVETGEIPESRIEDAVRRILRLKAKYGLLDWQPLDPETAAERVNADAHAEMVGAIYLNTVAFSRNDANLLPITPGAKNIALVYPGIYPAIGRECGAIDPSIRLFAYSTNPTGGEIVTVRNFGREVDVVVMFTYNVLENRAQADMVQQVPPEKAVVVSMQNPYDYELFNPPPGGYVAAFNTYPSVFRAACMVLLNQHPAKGTFPIVPLG